MELEEGMAPEALKVLAGHLIGEVISIVWESRPNGRQAARVHFYDPDARELNEDQDEPGNDHQEYFTHFYFFSPDYSRVTEIYDTDGSLIEKDPIPWALQPSFNGSRPVRTPDRRSRPSALAAERAA